MQRLVIAAVIVVVVGVVALVLRARQRVDAPTQAHHEAPAQLDRGDFPAADEDWLVVAFTSASCHACADVAAKARAAASRSVGVVEVEYGASRALHDRYAITAVPTLVVADRDGVVRASFLGPVSATDLWAAIAEVRSPGSLPHESCQRHDHE